jgi:hypothetical protein
MSDETYMPDPDVVDALAAYAESDDAAQDIEAARGHALRGDDAAEHGRALLARGGRPGLGQERATGRGSSPKRQVRLPATLNARLDDYAASHDTTPSAVIRCALDDYFARAGAPQ